MCSVGGERKHNKKMGNESKHTKLREMGNNEDKDMVKKISAVERKQGHEEQQEWKE